MVTIATPEQAATAREQGIRQLGIIAIYPHDMAAVLESPATRDRWTAEKLEKLVRNAAGHRVTIELDSFTGFTMGNMELVRVTTERMSSRPALVVRDWFEEDGVLMFQDVAYPASKIGVIIAPNAVRWAR